MEPTKRRELLARPGSARSRPDRLALVDIDTGSVRKRERNVAPDAIFDEPHERTQCVIADLAACV